MGSLDTPTRTYSYTEIQQAIPDARQLRDSVNLKPSTSYAMGSRLGPITASPGVFGPYNSGASDGTQKCAAIVPRDLITDASGNIFVGTVVGGEFGEYEKAVPVIFGGAYACADLPGLTTQEVTDLGGKIIRGSTTTGILIF